MSLDEPEPVDSVLTFLNGYDTQEYSWVKATAVSLSLRILFVTLQNTNNDVVCGSAGESLVLLVLWIVLVVDDEVEYRSSPIWIGDQYFLAYRAGARSVLVGGSSSILTVGELRACTKLPAGTSAHLGPSLESTSAAT